VRSHCRTAPRPGPLTRVSATSRDTPGRKCAAASASRSGTSLQDFAANTRGGSSAALPIPGDVGHAFGDAEQICGRRNALRGVGQVAQKSWRAANRLKCRDIAAPAAGRNLSASCGRFRSYLRFEVRATAARSAGSPRADGGQRSKMPSGLPRRRCAAPANAASA